MKMTPTYETFIRSSETKSNTVPILQENYKVKTMELQYISIRPERQETEKRYKVSKVL